MCAPERRRLWEVGSHVAVAEPSEHQILLCAAGGLLLNGWCFHVYIINIENKQNNNFQPVWQSDQSDASDQGGNATEVNLFIISTIK